MYMDTVVIAGIGTVLLVCGFFGAVGAFIAYDRKRHKEDNRENTDTHRKAV
ncbi:MAG: cytochrome c oxidase subunit CcoM [Marinobacter sp.]|nr:cytochrome c oxidase subunit CcoM [Marinobacter sp.]